MIMQKVFLSLLLMIGFIAACSDKAEQSETAQQQEVSSGYENMIFSYKQGEIKTGCSTTDALICAVELVAKCTINPKYEECKKDMLPAFIFMEDASLQRPTEMSFKVYKLKPLSGGNIEAYTESSCNGGWFGLCQGNVIYVLTPQADGWKINDIYSLAQ